ncbi:LOW QUALITY PROTEIN: elongator complex protein 5-like [Drosophila tropicalis]|uniref:LOW QUALITY PROTEIN: elongator complex protein 5-like n=1 Tax=Drosophila tropicalis TaxID=46794 RepID=UPI0035AB7044
MNMSIMLSNLIVTNQRVVLIIDELNREHIAVKFIRGLLNEQWEEADSIKTMPTGSQLKHVATYETLLNECSNYNISGYNVILPTLADLLCYQSPTYIFEFLNKLRRSKYICRVFLWASPQKLQHLQAEFILSGCEYMAELVLRLETEALLSLISRKPSGGVSNKRYSYQVSKTQFQVTELETTESHATPKTTIDCPPSEPAGGTLKIELDEDEMMARNALTLPYERTSEPTEGTIINTPDANDDFDEENPDEDLNL